MPNLRRLIGQQLPAPLPGPRIPSTRLPARWGCAQAEWTREGLAPDGRSWFYINNDGPPHLLYFRAADELADRERAYGLGYRTYRAMGYAAEKEPRTLVLPCDAHPDTLSVLATDPLARAAGTVSLWFDRSGGLPSEAYFSRELKALRESGGRLVEAGRFAIHDDYRHCTILVARLLNLIFLYALRVRACTHLVCTVNPRHVAFYLRKLSFRELGRPRPCSRVNGALAELLVLDLAHYAREVRKAHARGQHAGGHPSLYGRFLSPDQELEAASLLARTHRPMSSEVAAYYRLNG